MEYDEITSALFYVETGDMITIEMNDGSTKYGEFVSTDSVGETITIFEDGGTETLNAGDLTDVTVGNDY